MSATVEQLLEEAKSLSGSQRVALAGKLVEGADFDLEKTFTELAERWRAETGMHSSVSRLVTHPAYLSIIGLGRPALPLILGALKRKPEHWFVALKAIARHSPVRPEQVGNVPQMAAAWLEWGRQNRRID
jgi:hypothetical protein